MVHWRGVVAPVFATAAGQIVAAGPGHAGSRFVGRPRYNLVAAAVHRGENGASGYCHDRLPRREVRTCVSTEEKSEERAARGGATTPVTGLELTYRRSGILLLAGGQPRTD
jgi:hypothetical protein